MENAEIAMNTIPSTFNQKQIDYTVLWGNEKIKRNSLNISCILLNRNSSQFRKIALENLLAKNFCEIISVEKKSDNFNTANLSLSYPSVKFITTLEDVTEGELLNIGMHEASTEYALVIHDDLCWQPLNFNQNLISKFIALNKFCIAPKLFSNANSVLPVNLVPSINDQSFSVEEGLTLQDGSKTLYPLDYDAFYNVKKFKELLGCDYTITSAYWQKLDLFMRAWLWGEEVNLSSFFNLTFAGEFPAEEIEFDSSYIRFYLKNLLPVFNGDHAFFSSGSFRTFKKTSKYSLTKAMELFKTAKVWLSENQNKFKRDAASLILDWSK